MWHVPLIRPFSTLHSNTFKILKCALFIAVNVQKSCFGLVSKYKDTFMKANRGYKWCPTTNRPVNTQTSIVTNRKKLWAFASDSAKDVPSPKKVTKSDKMPQRNIGMADLTQMGGLSMLLFAGEHALTAQEIRNSLLSLTARPQFQESSEEEYLTSGKCNLRYIPQVGLKSEPCDRSLVSQP
ncbi:HMG box transcription factor BBX-like [Aquila chrysaetos chrysaetos]|uniref:HMG box transcription factor BBX-like n=1 Tax=Aquila chrysaetos chrysaetos TaxID=223781 RepID=UPI001176B4AE|nr:HMG box transcription factor BBX-like [Aquila chrysaetos chrysaetos]